MTNTPTNSGAADPDTLTGFCGGITVVAAAFLGIEAAFVPSMGTGSIPEYALTQLLLCLYFLFTIAGIVTGYLGAQASKRATLWGFPAFMATLTVVAIVRGMRIVSIASSHAWMTMDPPGEIRDGIMTGAIPLLPAVIGLAVAMLQYRARRHAPYVEKAE